ncbi:FHA domain-containing protein [Streptomyces profundus]|uniref:FHA domain-containing protein n=1 Tax=Streptomyces profundus TaxID=2867410 RepID=UPI001D160046|nr:FHA domain-containing protein [Streptomyces sp. MA3_2.13]UED87456.1 FHA domain-containing protein [Streptomyces sp. MA3_2.13]
MSQRDGRDERDGGDERDGWDGWDDEWDEPFPDDEGPAEAPDEAAPAEEPPAAVPAAAPCWNCDHPVPGGVTPCPICTSPRVHLVLTLDAPRLRAVAGPGRPLRLGRDPAWAPATAPGLTGAPGVSRRHATLTVDHDGTAWVADGTGTGSLNGTWINGRRVEPTEPRRLRDHDELGLGRRVRGTIRLHGQG